MSTNHAPLPSRGFDDEHRRSALTVLGRDSVYVLVGFPLAIVSFVAIVTGLSLSLGLALLWVGFPIAVGTLLMARLCATIERSRLEARGLGPVAGCYRSPVGTDGWPRRAFAVMRDPQSWLDALHAAIILPISTITFSIVISWSASGLGGITYWLWGGALPDDGDNETLPELLNLDVSDSLFAGVLGVVMLATLVPVVWACASVQASIGRALLANRHAAALEPALGRPREVAGDGAGAAGVADAVGVADAPSSPGVDPDVLVVDRVVDRTDDRAVD